MYEVTAEITDYLKRALERLESEFGPQIVKALSDPMVDEIMLNDDGALFFECKGSGMEKAGYLNPADAAAIVRTIASLLGKNIDRDSPVLSGEIPFNGSRFEGLLPPLVKAPSFSIRRHNALSLPLASLVEQGMLTSNEAAFLRQALKERRSIIVAGSTGCGKTTLINALLNELAVLCPFDRILTIEDTPELVVKVENRLHLYTSQHTDMSVLLRSALRLRPDRIIVGEVRGAEALDLVDALSTGHSGGLTTIHAGSVQQALKRLCLLISRHKSAPRLIEPTLAMALDIVVQLTRNPVRRIGAIAEVRGFNGVEFETDLLGRSIEDCPYSTLKERTHE